jgi:uncharacterized membrane-anchored protein
MIMGKQQKKQQTVQAKTTPFIWWRVGLIWGAFMYVFNAIIYPLFAGLKITLAGLLLSIVVWVVAGLLFGLILKFFVERKKKKLQK